MANRWEDAEDLLVACAEDDLREEGTVQPALVAFAGASLRFVAWVRPFEKGRYAQPLTELFALAAPLDCDRLMLSMSGRAWSLDDPIPPVSREADLRQPVLLLYVVDGADPPTRRSGVMRPFDLGPDGPVWAERRVLGPGEGWIPQAMAAVVACRDRLRAPVEEIARQATRVARLGHDLHLPPDLTLLLLPHVTSGDRGA
jgi:hypothetical protein